MSNYPSSLPLCVRFPGHFLWFWCGGGAALTSLKRYVFRDSMRDPACGSHLKPFWLKIVLLRVWCTCVLLTSVFIEWIGPRVPLTPKVCSFVILFVCTLRKHLKNTIQSRNCVLRKAFLSFSLRFCSAFKMHCKTRLEFKFAPENRNSLHTCSHENRFF